MGDTLAGSSVAVSEAGTPVLGNSCASATMTPGPVVIDEANCPPASSVAQHMVSGIGERSVDAELTMAADLEAEVGKGGVARGEHIHEA